LVNTPETEIADAETPVQEALPEATLNGKARRVALGHAEDGPRCPTTLVAYESAGRVAVIGHSANAIAAAERLAGSLECTAIITAGEAPGSGDDGKLPVTRGRLRTIAASVAEVRGHLGAFHIDATVKGEKTPLAPSLITAHKPFDIVLDLCEPPFVRAELPPAGYFAPCRNPDALELALKEIPEFVGDFEKPKYFSYEAGICAHGNSGLTGCSRCLEACPTDAIRSLKDLIEVDPYLCQGGGSCATACPTGAITYAYPKVADLLANLRLMLGAYRDAGGAAPGVVFHDAEAGRAWLHENAERLPENLIPFEVEEIGSVGLDAWLALVAYGARPVVLYRPQSVPGSIKAELEHQLGIGRAILSGMGYPPSWLVFADSGDAESVPTSAPSGAPPIEAANFAAVDEKRTTIRMALDHLFSQAPEKKPHVELPRGAPFGQIHVDQKNCTLCMACVSVCPASALVAGGEEPRLGFIEWNCVQCGLCQTACPEDAITLSPRLLFDSEARRAARVLNQDQAFHCVSCGRAFATIRVIERMRDKLKGHWMFQKPEAVQRLEMCEDCRVKDMFKDGGGLLDVHDRS
jgi:ferredoxin